MYKKVSLFVTTLLISSISCFAQDTKCTDFKVGTFEYSDPRFSEWKVSRTDTLQIEKSTVSGVEIYSSIKWISDCNYILTYKKVLNTDVDPSDFIGKTIEVKIIKTESDRYTCHSKSDVMDLEIEMVKVD